MISKQLLSTEFMEHFSPRVKGFELFEGILWDQVSLHIEDDYYGNQVCNAIFGRQLFKTSGQLDKQNPKTNNIADSSAEEAYHIFSHIHSNVFLISITEPQKKLAEF